MKKKSLEKINVLLRKTFLKRNEKKSTFMMIANTSEDKLIEFKRFS